MAFSFDISTGIQHGPQKIVIYGPEGIGKSSFAAKFPDPLFIDTEGSTKLLNVKRLPRPTSWTELIHMVEEVVDNPDVCKTLVIDTADWAERLCSEHVCKQADKESIESFGYGKGYVLLKEEFGRLLDRLSMAIEAGVNVVLTAHSTIRKFERPDESGAFDRWEMKLGNKTSGQISALVKEWADMLLFANYKEMIIEDPTTGKKKAHGGQRVMYTTHHPAFDAKNRHGLPDELPFSFTEIAFCLPPEEEKKADPKPAPEPEAKPEPKAEPEPKPEPKPRKRSPQNKDPKDSQKKPPLADAYAGIPKDLAELMRANNVTRDELQAVVGMRGYFPATTPIENYPLEFVDGCLVAAWDKVFGYIEENRNPLDVPF